MKKTVSKRSRRRRADADDILPEYDFRGARRNPYASQLTAGATSVVLDPDVAAVFSDSAMVNEALRALAKVIEGARSRRVSRVSEGKPDRS